MRMRARGGRDTTRQLVRAMHETLGRLVESNNDLVLRAMAMGTQLNVLDVQMSALGQRLIEVEEAWDGIDTRVTRLEKKRGKS